VPATTDDHGHFGGLVAFGPDRKLYISIGDGGEPEAAQDPTSLLGKLIRLRVADREPMPEIVAWGLRNPWRFSFVPSSGTVVIADVGGESREEIDVLPRRLFGRANFGWPAFEGSRRRSGVSLETPGVLVRPFAQYRHRGTRCWSVIGGLVYRGIRFPALRGRYVFGDLCGGMWSVRLTGPDAGRVRTEPLDTNGILTGIVEGRDHELLLVSGAGTVVTPIPAAG
jgi:hypothetical protein